MAREELDPLSHKPLPDEVTRLMNASRERLAAGGHAPWDSDFFKLVDESESLYSTGMPSADIMQEGVEAISTAETLDQLGLGPKAD